MNPYEVLGVSKTATVAEVKAAYRKLSPKHHPDKGGDRIKFEEIKLAFDVLSNPNRRSRYDALGRTDESPATPQRLQIFISDTMKSVVTAERQDGTVDDPIWENIRDKILLSIMGSRVPLKNQAYKLQRQLERTQRLIERFILKEGHSFDPVGKALAEEKARIEGELRFSQDAMELSIEAERILKTYTYEVGPGPEGHFSPRPTRPSRGPLSLPQE